MSNLNTNPKTPNPSNPSSLPARYSIRRLEPAHDAWTAALIAHANMFHNPVWSVLYPTNKATLLQTLYDTIKSLAAHRIASGMSFGVFDDAYEFRSEEARAAGGSLDWADEALKDDSGAELLKRMDFPLVSVALSFDSFTPLDKAAMAPLIKALPQFSLVNDTLNKLDTRDAKSWEATGPGQVLGRSGTVTRVDYEGQGLMAGLARWMMREAAAKGYRGIQITSLNDALTHVWGNPPSPFKGGVVSSFDTATWKDEHGNVAFEPSKQMATKCYVELC